MRLSKLLPKDYLRTNGPNANPERCHGATTGCALGMISKAMSHPGKSILLADDSHRRMVHSYDAMFASTVYSIVEKLELMYFDVKVIEGKYYLIYNVFEEVPKGRVKA